MRRETIRVTVEKEVDVLTFDLEPEDVEKILIEHYQAREEFLNRKVVKAEAGARHSYGEYGGHEIEFYLEPLE